ncbi:hydroxymethylglutaryl-CoA reductase, degradative [Atopobacter phocae]|uniref:hydroxymethylglutaryl-CoA reductase, degradative n=1 Tax=Atopobacter phocae TaxID=136492 RepID=UPI0004707495|nr:hydroxymethylglutaryl-CoA reductase, degradative [Atopobacter phocae]
MKPFYKLSFEERIDQLLHEQRISQEFATLLKEGDCLPSNIADTMIENVIGVYGLPLGLATHFLIDGVSVDLPLAVEEPSVVAAASNGAKRIKHSGGFKTKTSRLMLGHITFANATELLQRIHHHLPQANELLNILNHAIPSMVKRGGGATACWWNVIDNEYLTLYVQFDTKEAMGANLMNTALEHLSQYLTSKFNQEPLVAILSNAAEGLLSQVTCSVSFDQLATASYDGQAVAQRIAQLSHYAQVDPIRAATHNKGIMNGIDSLVIATGNDWRAVEAAAHSYACQNGQYRGLSQWTVNEATQTLDGIIKIPLPIGTVGGTSSIHPMAQIVKHIIHSPDAQTLSGYIASLGLAQNLSALRALVTTGIQSGHMALQYKSLAAHVGANGEEVPLLVEALKKQRLVNQAVAEKLLREIRS